MDITIQTIHFDASQQLESFIQKKVSKLDKYHDGIMSTEVTLKVTKPEVANNKEASIKISVPGQEFFVGKTSDTFEESIADSVEALEKQLIKFKQKPRSKKGTGPEFES